MNQTAVAAERGDADAQVSLGLMYAFGHGGPLDLVQAYKWFDLAASRYAASEKEGRDRAVRGRDLAAAKMTPAQITEAQKLAHVWRPKRPSRQTAARRERPLPRRRRQ